jgi:asparagine synthase (glutamine-hydrolysing)
MCGLTGFLVLKGHNKEKAKELVLKMTREIVHRGPDEEGIYVDDSAALGHRRLSIIDISSGQQPLSIGDESL